MNNSFAKTSRIDFEEREQSYDDSILDDLPCLDDCLTCPTYEEVETLFHELGEVPAGDDPEPEPEPEKPKERGLKRKRETVVKEDTEPELDENDCVACGGTGINSRGGVCKPCGGSGQKQVKKNETPKPVRKTKSTKKEDLEPEPEKPAQTRKQSKKDECPSGYRFGVDTDEYEECDECEKWDDCIESKESA